MRLPPRLRRRDLLLNITHQDARQVSLCELLFGLPEGLTLTPPKGVTFGTLRTPKRLQGIDC